MLSAESVCLLGESHVTNTQDVLVLTIQPPPLPNGADIWISTEARTLDKLAVRILLECFLVTARKQSLRRLCFYICLSVYRMGGFQTHAWREVEGLAGEGGSRPTPRGRLRGLAGEGLQAHIQGGVQAQAWGVSQHALRQTPPQQTATAVGGTHPTGMHSCSEIVLQRLSKRFFYKVQSIFSIQSMTVKMFHRLPFIKLFTDQC